MSSVDAPEWVNQHLFSGLLKQNYNDFDTIQKFECTAAISGGENYLTIVLRIGIVMRLKGGSVIYIYFMYAYREATQTYIIYLQADKSSKDMSYILKIPLVNDRGDEHDFHDLFITEVDMYERLVPELEELYARHTKLAIRFKPAHLKFTENSPNCDYILMEDLRMQGYINLERMFGLGQTEIKAVLKKLAQWHAASAQRVVELGDYEEKYQKSYISPESYKWIEQANVTFNVPFLECLQLYNLEPGQQQLIVRRETSYIITLASTF